MPSTTKQTLATLALTTFWALAKAMPRPDTGPSVGPGYKTFTITSQGAVDGAAFRPAGSFPVGATGQFQESYAVSYTVEVGLEGDLGIDSDLTDIEGLGLSASVSITTESSTSTSVSDQCPAAPAGQDQWTCGLSITPKMWQVSGTYQIHSSGGEISDSTDYTVSYPIVIGGNSDYFGDLCSCHNRPGWASDGAPALCPQDC